MTGLNCLHNFINEKRHYFKFSVERICYILLRTWAEWWLNRRRHIVLPPSPQDLKQRKGKSRLHSNKANTSYLLEENNRNHYYTRLQTWVAASQIILWQVQTLQSQPVSLVSYQKRNCSLGACRQSRYMRCDRVSIKRLRFWVQKGISDACTLTDCPRTLQSVLPWNFTFISAKDALFSVHRPDFSSPIDPLYRPIYLSVVHRRQKMTLDY